MNLKFTLVPTVLALMGCQSQDTKIESRQKLAFPEVSASTGLNFVHDAGVDGSYFMPESVGPGSAFFDYDNDGDQDIYLINGHNHNGKQSKELWSKNRLFRQEADGTFSDVTDESGLGDIGYGMGVAIGDIDNDDDLDVYITNYGKDALYLNNADGTFINITDRSGIDNPSWACPAAFLDYNLDGYLDIYVANYVDYDTSVHCFDLSGTPEYCGPASFLGSKDVLYRNNGDGSFTDVSTDSGIDKKNKKGLGLVTTDVNDDGYPDIYVANDREENILWMNQKNGTFKDTAMLMGIAVNQSGAREAGMGIALGDVNNDGQLDFFVTHFEKESNTLYLNQGERGYEDISQWAGFERIELLGYTGVGVGFADLDLDGNLDLVVGNGKMTRANQPPMMGADFWRPYDERNLIFMGDGEGRFKDTSSRFPGFCGLSETTRGLAFADYDNDGDVDVLVNNCGEPARLHRNDLEQKGNWLSITTYDAVLKRIPIGTTITVIAGERNSYHQINPGYSFFSSNDYRVNVGLGEVERIDEILITWPDGSKERFPSVTVNQHVTLLKGAGQNTS